MKKISNIYNTVLTKLLLLKKEYNISLKYIYKRIVLLNLIEKPALLIN